MNGPVKDPMANDPELDSLLGAYALDALEPDERARVEEYVAHNARARDEVDEMRESAAALALAPAGTEAPPPAVWDRIATEIAREPAPVASLEERRAGRSTWTPVVGILSVAAAVALLVLALEVVSLHGRLHNATRSGDASASAAFDHARSETGARQLSMTPPHGGEVARVVLLPDGHGFLKNDDMPKLAADQTYQLWALTGDPSHPTPISAGVLGSNPQAAAFRLAGDVHALAVTVEQAPGVVAPSGAPYASAALS